MADQEQRIYFWPEDQLRWNPRNEFSALEAIEWADSKGLDRNLMTRVMNTDREVIAFRFLCDAKVSIDRLSEIYTKHAQVMGTCRKAANG